MEQFGLSVNQASDLNRYISFAPDNMTYDKSARCYVRGPSFKSVFGKLDAGRYLAQLRSLELSLRSLNHAKGPKSTGLEPSVLDLAALRQRADETWTVGWDDGSPSLLSGRHRRCIAAVP